ncbi:MAG: cytochrome ubiquinol oxidase subunit I [Neomegalonema sp.]|nr:cytochrome ubiquinol oxidase subunit I [Neomegalonema sp.]
MEFDVTSLSRFQFAMTAMYHFLFVPLTLGLSMLVAIMETVYVMTDKPIWRQMTKFWGTLFGINFVLGVATGLTMEFQFGMNWSYYSHYVGDIFGAPLAIEGLMAFFLEATFVGLFFFGWDKLSKRAHLATAWAVALGSNFSALWILIANGWMQFPVGAVFNPDTMRMEIADFGAVLMNPVAQAKFVHTVSAGYVTAALFVIGVSAWYLLKDRHSALAKRSIAVAASFGLAASLSVVVLGDESGYSASEHQKMKLAAMEGAWETEKAPAGFTLLGFPDQEARKTEKIIEIPAVLGIIATRSLTEKVPGIKELVKRAETRIRSGLIAYKTLKKMRADRAAGKEISSVDKAVFDTHMPNLGYAFLLEPHLKDADGKAIDVTKASKEQIDKAVPKAAWDTVPRVSPLFWSFRAMVALGFYFILFTAFFFWRSSFKGGQFSRTALRIAVLSIPLPWIACELGWFVAEYGRQPWAIEGLLPTFKAASSLTEADLWVTIIGFVALYTVLLIIEMRLMVKYIGIGPYLDDAYVEEWERKRAAQRAALNHSGAGPSPSATPAE